MTSDEYNRRIFDALTAIQKDVAAIKKAVASGSATNGAGKERTGGEVADARDLDSQYGDPTIKYDPSAKYWKGDSFAGYRFSETTPDYLDAMAKYLDACAHMAAKDADEKKRKNASYKARDAARARGWAARLRSGWAPVGAGDDDGYGAADDDGIPF